MALRRLLPAMVVLAALGIPSTASACSCAGPGPGQTRAEHLRERISGGDGAIVGRLRSVSRTVGGRAFFRYRILYVVKGKRRLRRGRIVAVASATQESACGLRREVGRRFGLVLMRREGRWWGSLCDTYGPAEMRAQGTGAGRASAEPPPCPAG